MGERIRPSWVGVLTAAQARFVAIGRRGGYTGYAARGNSVAAAKDKL